MATYKKKSSKSFKKKTSTSKKCIVSQCVKKYVKATIHKNIENKTLQEGQTANYLTTYGNNTSLFTHSLLPLGNFSQGTSQNARLGNEIKPRKLMYSFCLRPHKYDVVFNTKVCPQIVIMIIGKLKGNKTKLPDSTDFAKLYQNGSVSQGPSNSLLDTVIPLNKDYFTIYKKMIFKVGYSQNSATGSQGPGGTDAGYQYFSNNEFKMCTIKRMDLTKYCPKTLKFNDASTNPTNDNLFVWSWAQPADGITGGSRPMIIDYSIDFQYEDA